MKFVKRIAHEISVERFNVINWWLLQRRYFRRYGRHLRLPLEARYMERNGR